MCGIAGIIDKTCNTPDVKIINKMLQSLSHRGPDDEGVYIYENLVLGHRRLSIFDTSAAGHQPMHYKHHTIVFNGAIYNYLEIRQELIELGHLFTTNSDTEVILHAFDEWAESCLERFIGMWAFVIVDKKQNRVFCSRDRFGIKPFYYFENERIFVFASEIKGIMAAGIYARVNADILMAYLVAGISDHTDSTFFKDIYQLPPGCYALINLYNGTKKIERYYDLSLVTRPFIEESDFSKCLEITVSLHLRSDVPVGTCLSGGLDSSTIAALASRIVRQNHQNEFGAITAQSESAYNDESDFARQVSEHCKLDWHLVKPTYKDFLNNIEECLRIQDEPVGSPSVFMQYWVMKTAKEAGLKVMLDGQGGDETLLGYERYYPAYFWYLFVTGSWYRLFREYYWGVRHSKLSFFLLSIYIIYFLILPLRKKILTNRMKFLKEDLVKQTLNTIRHSAEGFFDMKKMQLLELTKYQLPHLLRYEDRNSMAHSIEARVPFVEHHFIEAALSLAPTEKIKNGFTKYPLRQIADKILPKSIAWRRNKFGFEAPEALWLNKHLLIMQEKVDKSVLLSSICRESPNLQRLSLKMRWKLYNIAVWESQYHVET